MLAPEVERHAVLLVDDEPDILASLQDLIAATLTDIDVQLAESGQKALEIMQKQSFDLIISDYKMPGMNGLELLSEVRKTAPKTLRVLMTAFPDLSIAIDAINEAAVENFFVKPLDPDVIIQEIQTMVETRQADTQRARAFARALHLRKGGDDE